MQRIWPSISVPTPSSRSRRSREPPNYRCSSRSSLRFPTTASGICDLLSALEKLVLHKRVASETLRRHGNRHLRPNYFVLPFAGFQGALARPVHGSLVPVRNWKWLTPSVSVPATRSGCCNHHDVCFRPRGKTRKAGPCKSNLAFIYPSMRLLRGKRGHGRSVATATSSSARSWLVRTLQGPACSRYCSFLAGECQPMNTAIALAVVWVFADRPTTRSHRSWMPRHPPPLHPPLAAFTFGIGLARRPIVPLPLLHFLPGSPGHLGKPRDKAP